MAKRLCLECGGELVMAFHPGENERHGSAAAIPSRTDTTWRCGTCGQAFTSEQLRASKHLRPESVQQT